MFEIYFNIKDFFNKSHSIELYHFTELSENIISFLNNKINELCLMGNCYGLCVTFYNINFNSFEMSDKFSINFKKTGKMFCYRIEHLGYDTIKDQYDIIHSCPFFIPNDKIFDNENPFIINKQELYSLFKEHNFLLNENKLKNDF